MRYWRTCECVWFWPTLYDLLAAFALREAEAPPADPAEIVEPVQRRPVPGCSSCHGTGIAADSV